MKDITGKTRAPFRDKLGNLIPCVRITKYQANKYSSVYRFLENKIKERK